MQRLDTEASEVEEETETLASKFVNGDLPLETFLKEFVPMRERYHSLAARKESLALSVTMEEERKASAMP
tara:strand:+ start:604 stop:813 length:210 start_codon:yes stop_codon:yes gene_type:complete